MMTGIPGLRFHHLGLAVATPDAAFRLLALQGYTAGPEAFDRLQRVHLALRHHAAMPDVELIWPGDAPSPIDRIVKRGSTIYHICYDAEDPEAAIAAIEAAGLNVATVSPATPAILFGGRPVSFHLIDGFGLIELLAAPPAQIG